MKKLSVILIVIIMTKSVFPLKLGMEFKASEQATVGVNLRLTEKFELKPQLGFGFAEDNNRLHVIVDGNFYLPQMQNLQHYAGPGIAFSVYTNDTYFNINGRYGLRYDFNEVISAFGEMGIGVNLDPFNLSTFKGGLGVTFYFPGIK